MREKYFNGDWPDKSPSLIRKIIKFEWNSHKTIYRRVQNSGKVFYMLIEANIMYLALIYVITCEEIPGEELRKNSLHPLVKHGGDSVTM